ncbi:hypothetical protein LTS17_001911 [Exophiala oligosperma]
MIRQDSSEVLHPFEYQDVKINNVRVKLADVFVGTVPAATGAPAAVYASWTAQGFSFRVLRRSPSDNEEFKNILGLDKLLPTIMATSFSEIPVIDFARLRSPANKPLALQQLKDALFKVGFLYLINTGLESVLDEGHRAAPELFNLPAESKEKCSMINSPSFLGYTALGAETTASQTDLREQFDFGTPVTNRWTDNDPLWQRLEGPSQYPDAKTEDLANRLIYQMSGLAATFLEAVAECLELPKDTFAPFRGHMDRLKFIKYPPSRSSQGVGPHKDSTGLFTFLSQDSVGGLQVLNRAGQWIDAPPVPDSLVVNIAQGFEAITGGRCHATTHRVVVSLAHLET